MGWKVPIMSESLLYAFQWSCDPGGLTVLFFMCPSAGGSSHHPHPCQKEDKKRRHFPQGNVSPSPACFSLNSLMQNFLDHGALFANVLSCSEFNLQLWMETAVEVWKNKYWKELVGFCLLNSFVFISRMMMKMTRRKRTIMLMICWGKELAAPPCWQTEPGYLLPLFVNHHIIICYVRALTFAVIWLVRMRWQLRRRGGPTRKNWPIRWTRRPSVVWRSRKEDSRSRSKGTSVYPFWPSCVYKVSILDWLVVIYWRI